MTMIRRSVTTSLPPIAVLLAVWVVIDLQWIIDYWDVVASCAAIVLGGVWVSTTTGLETTSPIEAASGQFNGTVRQDANGPLYILNSTGAGANAGLWYLQALNPGFRLGSAADDLSSQFDVITVTRSGTNVSAVTLAVQGASVALDNDVVDAFKPTSGSGTITLGSGANNWGEIFATLSPLGSGGSEVNYDPASGLLFVPPSSCRFKRDILDLDVQQSWRIVNQLRPVSFRYHGSHANPSEDQIGLIAEEVEKIDPSLISYDKEGMPLSVSYSRVVVPLLSALQDLQSRVAVLESSR